MTNYFSILNRFPNIELSYENIPHNKVQDYDLVFAIPKGEPCFIWFTYFEKSNACFILKQNDVISRNDKPFSNIFLSSAIFDNDLSLGTIFYGTLFDYDNSKFFCIQNISYYKGDNISHYYFKKKLSLINHILDNEIDSNILFSNQLVFGLPIMSNSRNTIYNQLDSLPYSISHLQYIFLHKHETIFNSNYTKVSFVNSYSNSPTLVFNVSADVQNDIYLLHCFHKGNIKHFYDHAFIPDYKTSVMMNSIFRDIKENRNLDLLEESDSEDEFENIDIDKFVNLKKNVFMICAFNFRFKKWVPTKLVRNSKICNLYTLNNFVKNNYVLPPSSS